MKEKTKSILIGVVLLIFAFVAPVLWPDATFRILRVIPVNATVASWFSGIVGALCILVNVLDKKKD